MAKKKVVVFGAGKIGRLVVLLLAKTEKYAVTIVDFKKEQVDLASHFGPQREHFAHVTGEVANFREQKDLERLVEGKEYVVNCAPFYCNEGLAEAAAKFRAHYLDLTEDVQTTKKIREMSRTAQSAFIPQCGLAPGFVSIVAQHLMSSFERIENVRMRVGALPMFPHNRLKYNLTWSTDGLINEYCNGCDAIVEGKRQVVLPLEGLERLHFEGEEYEAFNTSGGLGSLADSLANRVRNLDYKTIRYPGHRDLIYTLLYELKFVDDRDTLKKVFERSLPHTEQDVVLIYVTVTGEKGGRLSQMNFAKKVYHQKIHGTHWGAIQITTAASLCAVLDLHASQELPQKGLIRQEDVSYDKFINNQFGKYYV